MKKYTSLILAALIGTILFGCGGGGGGGSSVTKTGTFVDSAVAGVTYKTATQSGVTNANGEFTYLDGEEVTFSLYGQPITVAGGNNVLTPFDSTVALGDDYSINALRLLQTLDSDSNPANGITLPSAAGNMNLNFNQSIAAFTADPNVNTFVTDNASGHTLVTAAAALTHFASTVANVNNDYVLSLAGRNASSVITSSRCVNDVKGGYQYSFTSDGSTVTGTDTFISDVADQCTLGASSTTSFAYKTAPDFALDCGPVCSYAQVNRMQVGTDIDGRDFVATIWHTPGTNVVTSIKRITSGAGSPNNFKEVITFQ